MTTQDLIELIDEGLENERIPAYLAAYIRAELLGVAVYEANEDLLDDE